MSERVGVNLEASGRTDRRLALAASDLDGVAGRIAETEIPGGQLAAQFAGELRRLLATGVVAVGDMAGWAETARSNVRATVRELVALDADFAAEFVSLTSQAAARERG